MRKTFFISLLALCFAASTWAVNVAKIGTTEYETLPAAVAAATNGQTVQLLGNVTAGPGVMIAKADAKQITIDFGGFTYCVTSPAVGSANTQTQGFHFEQGCVITMKNGTITSSGTEVKMLVQNYCDLTLENIVLDGSNLGGNGTVYTLSNNNGDVVIGNGAEVIARSTSGVAFDVCYYANYPSVHVTVKEGATINGKVEMSMSSGRGATVEENCELTIEGGEFTNFSISHSNIPEASVNSEITGGTFDAEVPAVYFAEGAAPVDNGNGTWSVQQQYVAKIGNDTYATLPAAVAAATNGQTVELVANETAGAGVMIAQADAKQITIDFGGHTYCANSPAVGSASTQNQAFHFERGCNITMKNGTVTCSGTAIKMLVQNYGDLTLENIVLDGSNLNIAASGAYTLSNNCGAIVIGDGAELIAKEGGFAFDVCNWQSAGYESVSVTVLDGATINGKVEISNYPKTGVEPNANLAVTGGTFTNFQIEAPTAVVPTVAVSAGTFDAPVPEVYCAPGFVSVTVPNAQGLYVVEQADYQREVTTTYGSLCLPKDGEVIGATVFRPAYKNGAMIFFEEVDGNRIVGGHGYLFQRKADYTKVSVKYDDANAPAAALVTDEAMIGTYDQVQVAADQNYAIIYNDKYYRVNSDNVYVRENGAYINLNAPILAEAVPVPGRRYISFQDAAVNDITGVEEIEAAENAGVQKVMLNGQLYIIRGEQIYNVAGQVVK